MRMILVISAEIDVIVGRILDHIIDVIHSIYSIFFMNQVFGNTLEETINEL